MGYSSYVFRISFEVLIPGRYAEQRILTPKIHKMRSIIARLNFGRKRMEFVLYYLLEHGGRFPKYDILSRDRINVLSLSLKKSNYFDLHDFSYHEEHYLKQFCNWNYSFKINGLGFRN